MLCNPAFKDLGGSILGAILADTRDIRVAESLLSWWGPQKALTTTRIYTTVEGTHRTTGEHQNTVQISTVSEGTNGCWWMLMDVDGCWWMLMDVDGCWWMLMDVDGCWWMLMDVDGCWWMLMGVANVTPVVHIEPFLHLVELRRSQIILVWWADSRCAGWEHDPTVSSKAMEGYVHQTRKSLWTVIIYKYKYKYKSWSITSDGVVAALQLHRSENCLHKT